MLFLDYEIKISGMYPDTPGACGQVPKWTQNYNNITQSSYDRTVENFRERVCIVSMYQNAVIWSDFEVMEICGVT